MRLLPSLLGLFLAVAANADVGREAPPGFERTEEREACADYRPLRQPLFGDLHVHTALSFDAAGQGTRARPRDAYRFAKGETLPIQPFAADGSSTHRVRLSRPLDFAMVSDHSDMLGETQMCQRPELPGWDSWACTIFRQWPLLGYSLLNTRYSMEEPERMSFCGEDGRACLEAAIAPWLAPGDRVAAWRGFHHGVLLERPVYSLHRAVGRLGAGPGIDATIARYELDAVFLTTGGLAEVREHLRASRGEPQRDGSAELWRIR